MATPPSGVLPRPIHHPSHELRSEPDALEPPSSGDESDILAGHVGNRGYRLAQSDFVIRPRKSVLVNKAKTAQSTRQTEHDEDTEVTPADPLGRSFERLPSSGDQIVDEETSRSAARRARGSKSKLPQVFVEGDRTASGHCLAEEEGHVVKRDSASARGRKKEAAKMIAAARKIKREVQEGVSDFAHLPSESTPQSSAVRFSSEGDDSTCAESDVAHDGSDYTSPNGSLRQNCLSSRSGMLSSNPFGRSAYSRGGSGVSDSGRDERFASERRRKINLLIDQCENTRFPFKKKLVLTNMDLAVSDIPVDDICSNSLCQSLYKLSLQGNHLGSLPEKLVQKLYYLKTLDLSQCELKTLPKRWNLPALKKLDLSHNRLVDFPDEDVLAGIPEVNHLELYGNKICEIIVPRNGKLLSKLDHLDLGNNVLSYLPEDMALLTSLKTLKVKSNLLEKIPMQVCEMDLKTLEVSANPLIQPPVETCERGIQSMRRYYQCLKTEESSRQKMLEDMQKRAEMKRRQKMKLESKKKAGKRKTPRTVLPDESADGRQNGYSPMSPPANREGCNRKSVTPPSPPRSEPPSPQSISSPSEVAIPKKLPNILTEKTIIRDEKVQNVGAYVDGPGGVLRPDLLSSKLRDEESSELATEEVIVAKDQRESFSSDLTNPSIAEDEPLFDLGRPDEITVNDTLKVIFVGMAFSGKTSIIKRLLDGKDAEIPTRDERTIGVDIYEWDPKKHMKPEWSGADTRIQIENDALGKRIGDVDVKFSMWDFAGQHVYHATHELFFSPRALYVLVWDMGVSNRETQRRRKSLYEDQGAFKLSYDSEEEEEDDFGGDADEEARRADRALEHDIDQKVQFWVDCIQSSAPGAAILPVASFDDFFDNEGGTVQEAKRRCTMLKSRLQRHEERRRFGLQQRLQEFQEGNRANAEAALHIQQLLCPFSRPKLIFGSDNEDSVVRVSCTKYTGFNRLAEKIIHIATGIERGGWDYPIFRGHVGARIPQMRLQVRDVVREMRDRFKVVEWGYFIDTLKERGIDNVDDVSDALHFLTNTGELSYFGDVVRGDMKASSPEPYEDSDDEGGDFPDEYRDDDFDEEEHILANDKFVDNMENAHNGEARVEAIQSYRDSGGQCQNETHLLGLSQYIFLNPRWLVAAVACILRHDLSREINERRRELNRDAITSFGESRGRDESFDDAHLNCPVITAEDACMLWQAKKFTKKAAERAREYSNNMSITPFDFLQRLLVRFGVFVPIDLSIEKALLAGQDYGRFGGGEDGFGQRGLAEIEANRAPKFFFLPSLLGRGEPSEVWTYKNTDSWKIVLAHSILFPDGVPPGLMERITASVLSNVYGATQMYGSREQSWSDTEQSVPVPQSVAREDSPHMDHAEVEPELRIKEILCWRSAFYLKFGQKTINASDGEWRESIVEVFAHLVDRESRSCVAADSMGVGMRRLMLSARGPIGECGRKIWTGGYELVIKAVGRVMSEYGGLELQKQGVCPECLAKRPLTEASVWDWSLVRMGVLRGDDSLRCSYGHKVEIPLLTGVRDTRGKAAESSEGRLGVGDSNVPVADLLRGVVVVGLWDGKSEKIVRVGSGFIVDRKRGLIVTASHTLMNVWGESGSPFGENYFGLRNSKVVVGVIPRERGVDKIDGTTAFFRYFAKIVAKDDDIEEKGICHMDACVLQITTKMEEDVGGDGSDCGKQPERLLNDVEVMRKEKLHQLKVSTKECELDEHVRILGYNQGGEGLMRAGVHLNRCVDFARGYVCMKFHYCDDDGEPTGDPRQFLPKEELVVICPTIGGHSGGPCVNQQGEVIGILSRADPAERQRCYLVPSRQWVPLVRRAKEAA